MAKADTKAPPKASNEPSEQAVAPVATAVPVVAHASARPKRFRLWDRGALKHDGMRIEPGEELPLDEAELISLGLMHMAVPIDS